MFTVAKAVEGQLLRAWREARGLSQAETAGRLERPMEGSEVGRYERGRSSPSVRTLLNLISGLDIPGRDDAERLARFFHGPEWRETVVPKDFADYCWVREDAEVGAGPGTEWHDSWNDGGEPLPFLERDVVALGGLERVRLVRVARGNRGKSMLPTLRPGARLLVQLGPFERISQGDLYVVVRPHEGAVVKRVFQAGEALLLWSDNPDYTPQREEVTPDDGDLNEVIKARVRRVIQDEGEDEEKP